MNILKCLTVIYLLSMTSLIITACSNSSNPDKNRIAVYGMTIKNRPIIEKQVFFAEITPRYSTNLSFRVSGKVLTRAANNGEWVKKGSLIGSLDPADYQLTLQIKQQQVNNARFEAEQSGSDEKRYHVLARRGALRHLDYDRQKTMAAKNNTLLLQATQELEMAQNNLEYTHLLAPYDGIMADIGFEVGEVIQQGQAIAVIYNNASLEVAVNLPAELVSNIKVWKPRLRLWDDGGFETGLVFREIFPIASAGTKTWQARFSFKDDSLAKTKHLLPGMSGKIILTRKSKLLYSRIPAMALIQYGNKTGIWQYNSNHSLTFLPVKIHSFTLNDVIVFALPEDIVIITAGAQKIQPSTPVSVTLQPIRNADHE